MKRRRAPRHLQVQQRTGPTISLVVAAILLVACQYAVMPQESPPPKSSNVSDEAATPTLPVIAETANLSPATVGLIQLKDPLDEPEFYCVDVPGFGRNLNLQGALTAHTCKPGADDEMFLLDAPSPGQISMPAYNLCMEAGSAIPGSTVHLADCSAAPIQQFQYTESSQILLVNNTGEALCLTVASEVREPTGGPSHLRRDLTLESCDLAEAARSRWTVGSATVVASEP